MSVMTREEIARIAERYAGLQYGTQATPAQIYSQSVSQEFPLAFWQTTGVPDAIPVQPPPPVFRSEVEQLDLFRVLMLVLGIVIGVKVLR